MKKDAESKNFVDDPLFQQFVSREFDKTARHATVEELSEFAFGSFEEAIKEYGQYLTDQTNQS